MDNTACGLGIDPSPTWTRLSPSHVLPLLPTPVVPQVSFRSASSPAADVLQTAHLCWLMPQRRTLATYVSHVARDTSLETTHRRTLLTYNHPRWPRPEEERSRIADHSFPPFCSRACRLKPLITPITNPQLCCWSHKCQSRSASPRLVSLKRLVRSPLPHAYTLQWLCD